MFKAIALMALSIMIVGFSPRMADEERLASQLLKAPPRCCVCTVVHETEGERVMPMGAPQKGPKPAKRWAGASAVQAQATRPKKPSGPPEVTYARIRQRVTVVRCVLLPRCR